MTHLPPLTSWWALFVLRPWDVPLFPPEVGLDTEFTGKDWWRLRAASLPALSNRIIPRIPFVTQQLKEVI